MARPSKGQLLVSDQLLSRFNLHKYDGCKNLELEQWAALLLARHEWAFRLKKDWKQSAVTEVTESILSDPLSAGTDLWLKLRAIKNFLVRDICLGDVLKMYASLERIMPSLFQDNGGHSLLPLSGNLSQDEIANYFAILEEKKLGFDIIRTREAASIHGFPIAGEAHLAVDLTGSDQDIVEGFRDWLAIRRREMEAYGVVPPKKNSFHEENDGHKWANSRVLPCIDLLIIAKLKGIRLTNKSLASAIYPEFPDGERKISGERGLKAKVNALISHESIWALMAHVTSRKKI